MTVLVLLAGCNAVYGLDNTVLADAPSCLAIASSFDDFERPTTMPCSWGYLTQNNCSAIAGGGVLSMTPVAGATDAICVCGTDTPITFSAAFGTIVEVVDVATLQGEYTGFLAVDPTSGTGWSIGYESPTMLYFNRDMTRLGSTAWGVSSRWWRIRPNDTGTAVLGEVSPDGNTWSVIATDSVSPPAMIRMEFSTGTFQSVAAPSTARIGSINVCPR